MFRALKNILGVTVCVSLVACGGGGDENNSTSPVASAKTFSLMSLKSLRQNSYYKTFNISGTCSGNGSDNSGAPYNSNLYGATYGRTSVLTLNYTNCSGSGAATKNTYFNNLFESLVIVNSDGKFTELSPINPLPDSVRVGDAVSLSNLIVYSSAAKTTQLYTAMQSLAVEPDTSESVILKIVTIAYQSNNQPYLTTQDSYRLDANGNLKNLSFKVDAASGQTETWTYN